MLANKAKSEHKRIQFLSGVFGMPVDNYLVKLAMNTDNISIYMQGINVSISVSLSKYVRLDGVRFEDILWEC